MRVSKLLLMFVGAGLLLAAPAPSGEKKESDLDRLRGAWKVARGEQAGKELPDVADLTITFRGDKLVAKKGEEVHVEATVKLDPSTTPRVIDLTFTGGSVGQKFKDLVAEGIYELGKDELKWCLSVPGSMQRPPAFKTEGTEFVLIVLKREAK